MMLGLLLLVLLTTHAAQIARLTPNAGPASGGTKIAVRGFGFTGPSLFAHLDVVDEGYHIVPATIYSTTRAEFVLPEIKLESSSGRTLLALVALHPERIRVQHEQHPEPFRIYEAPEIHSVYPSHIESGPDGQECFLLGSNFFDAETIRVKLIGKQQTNILEGFFDVFEPENDKEESLSVISFYPPQWSVSENVTVELSFNGQQFHGGPVHLEFAENGSLLDQVANQLKDTVTKEENAQNDTVVEKKVLMKESTSTFHRSGLKRRSKNPRVNPELLKIKLTDSDGNEFVLSRPSNNRDVKPDFRFLSDGFIMTILCATMGAVSLFFRGSPVIGFLLAGLLLDQRFFWIPYEIQQPIQMSSLANFGGTLMLFEIGRLFSLSRFARVTRIVLWGGLGGFVIASTIFSGMAFLFRTSVAEAILIGWYVMMSSTAICTSELEQLPAHANSLVGDALMGILIFQDVCLGVLLSSIPYLALGTISSPFELGLLKHETIRAAAITAALVLHLLGQTLLFVAIALVISFLILPVIWRLLARTASEECFLLCTIGYIFAMALAAEANGLSMELGAFVAGLVYTQLPKSLLQLSSRMTASMNRLFSAFFFCSIGFSTDFYFIMTNWTVLLCMFLTVAIVKLLIMFPVIRFGGKMQVGSSVYISVALAHVGEFALLLLGKAHSYGLVSKKVYMLLVGTAFLSMLVAPLMLRSSAALLGRKKRLFLDLSAVGSRCDMHSVLGGADEGGKLEAQDFLMKARPWMVGGDLAGDFLVCRVVVWLYWPLYIGDFYKCLCLDFQRLLVKSK